MHTRPRPPRKQAIAAGAAGWRGGARRGAAGVGAGLAAPGGSAALLAEAGLSRPLADQ